MGKLTRVFDILLGLVFGDEGKGKIVDYLAHQYHIVARFQGGPNAGHTLWVAAQKYVLHHIPSGILHEKVMNFIGKGVVISPVILMNEIVGLESRGVSATKNLVIASSCPVTLPTHRVLEAISEVKRGNDAIGSTLKAITPTYVDFYGRQALLFKDFVSCQDLYSLRLYALHCEVIRQTDESILAQALDLLEKPSQFLVQTAKERLINFLGREMSALEEARTFFFKHRHLIVADSYAADAFYAGKSVLAEGAQGCELSIGSSNYPFNTSSYVSSASACEQLGISPLDIREVIGVMKCYSTKVGGGDLLGEILDDNVAEALVETGDEFGSTTGRKRKPGWNLVDPIGNAIRRNGVTRVIITKCDIPFLANISAIGLYIGGLEEKHLCMIPVQPHSNPNAPLGTSRTITQFVQLLEKNLNAIPGVSVQVTHITNGPNREDILSTRDPIFEGV
ncbi:MAG: adenylosuccinate synthetase [Candidatus Pacebacteria bacterium]|nr:adenylosuccinate synthetase [Candidatus Paceibacterota bacterium]